MLSGHLGDPAIVAFAPPLAEVADVLRAQPHGIEVSGKPRRWWRPVAGRRLDVARISLVIGVAMVVAGLLLIGAFHPSCDFLGPCSRLAAAVLVLLVVGFYLLFTGVGFTVVGAGILVLRALRRRSG